MTLTNIILLMFAAPTLWWVSGFDPQLTRENQRRDFIRRTIRCLATLVLLEIFFGPDAVRVGYAFIPLLLIVPPLLGVMWAGCLAEIFSRGFHRLIDSDDRRTFDAGKSARDLDRVARLLESGQREEALQLCGALEKSGEVNPVVLETLLERAGIPRENFKKPKPLAEAHQRWTEGKLSEAEAILQSLLAKNPADTDAALMLMRLYARDLRRSDKAAGVLRSLEQQPHVPPALLEYARRSIVDWGQRKSVPASAPPASVDELLTGGYLGTAIELLEQRTKEQLGDFDSWLKLAEAHGRHSGNFQRAEKIVRQIESNRGFSAEQIQMAKARLEEWRPGKMAKD